MNDLGLFIIGVAVFSVTLMAVLWTGYLTFAKAAEVDQARSTPKLTNHKPEAATTTGSDRMGQADRRSGGLN